MISDELRNHLAMRRAGTAIAIAMRDQQGDAEDETPIDPVAAAATISKAAKPALSVVTKSEHESNMAWLSKSMSNTKEQIWTQIQAAAAKDPATNGLGLTVEQAEAKFLSTPAGNKLYEAWTKAPWDAGTVRKAEEAGAPRGTSQVRRSAADQATLAQMGRDAEASIK